MQLRTAFVLSLGLLLTLGACSTMKKPEILREAVPTAPLMAPSLQPSAWEALPGWDQDDPAKAWGAFLESCDGLKNRLPWQQACSAAAALNKADGPELRAFFQQYFTPYQVVNGDGSRSGLITGYYEPLLHGSRVPTARYRYPLYGVPDDLLTVDLSSVYPELKGMRLRGRLQGRRVVPYYSRAEIDDSQAPLKGKELLWVDNALDLFFLQIQGSGRVRLEDGETIRVGYADQNGYPYKSIGRLLVERGELPLEKASLEGIKEWARQHPDKLPELLDSNASYVFFREMPDRPGGPVGALGVPLSAGRSLAVDPRAIPLGAPVFISTTWPDSDKPLNRLMLAQDTGGAIKGGVRADFFWGFGDDAGALAGAMKQSGRLWVLLPKGYTPPKAD